MKLSGYALIFVMIVWCVFSRVSFQNGLLWKNAYGSMMYNQIMDNLIEDSLRQVISFQDNQPQLDYEKLSHYLISGIQHYKRDFSNGGYFENNIRFMIVTFSDGYCLWGLENCIAEDGSKQWTEKIFYEKGVLTSREEKVNTVMQRLYEEAGVELSIPNREGEALQNTLDDYSLIVVYQSFPYVFEGKTYQKLIFSGAKLEYEILFTE